MFIPSIPAFLDDNKDVSTGKLEFEGTIVAKPNHTTTLKEKALELIGRFGKGNPILMFDVDGLANKKISFELLKKIKMRKAEKWIITHIETVDDVFDIFYMDTDTLLVPYHTIRSYNVLKEINIVSDKCIPTVFTERRVVQSVDGKEMVWDVMRKIEAQGFTKIAVMDMSGTFDHDMWAKLFSEFSNIVPFVRSQTSETINDLMEIGFQEIFITI